MPDAKPRLTLVTEAMQADPPKEHQAAQIEAVLNRYGPSIAKRVRQDERAALFQRLGAQSVEEASQLAQLRKERDARPTRSEYGRHGMARLAQGAFLGLLFGSVFVSWLTMAVIIPMNEQTRASTEAGVMIGTAASVHGAQPVLTRPEGN